MRLAGCLPSLRHLPLPPNHHPPTRLQEQRSSADDRLAFPSGADGHGSCANHDQSSNLYYCRHPRRHRRVLLRQSRQTQPLHHRLPAHDGCRLLHVHRHRSQSTSKGGLRRRVFGGLRHLPCLPGCHRLAIKQLVWLFEAVGRHGIADWCGQFGRCK